MDIIDNCFNCLDDIDWQRPIGVQIVRGTDILIICKSCVRKMSVRAPLQQLVEYCVDFGIGLGRENAQKEARYRRERQRRRSNKKANIRRKTFKVIPGAPLDPDSDKSQT